MARKGIVREVDKLGRVVIPIEFRRSLNIAVTDPVEIFVNDDFVLIRKHQETCFLCGNKEDIITHCGKKICKKCISELSKEC